MKFEVSPLQLAEWLIHGIAVIISLLQVDSVNDRTRWPIPRAWMRWERIGNIQGLSVNFCPDFIADLAPQLSGETFRRDVNFQGVLLPCRATCSTSLRSTEPAWRFHPIRVTIRSSSKRSGNS